MRSAYRDDGFMPEDEMAEALTRVKRKYRECPHCEANFLLFDGESVPRHRWRKGVCPGGEVR